MSVEPCRSRIFSPASDANVVGARSGSSLAGHRRGGSGFDRYGERERLAVAQQPQLDVLSDAGQVEPGLEVGHRTDRVVAHGEEKVAGLDSGARRGARVEHVV